MSTQRYPPGKIVAIFKHVTQTSSFNEKLTELKKTLVDIRQKNRPNAPPKEEKLTAKRKEEYKEHKKKYDLLTSNGVTLDKVRASYPDIVDINLEVNRLKSLDLHQIYLSRQAHSAYRSYKSDEYKTLEANYKLYTDEANKTKKSGGPNPDLLKQLSNFPNFELIHTYKELSKEKIRLPKSSVKALQEIARQITAQLGEHAFNAAVINSTTAASTVYPEHCALEGYKSYTTYPLFAQTDAFGALNSRKSRRDEFIKNSRFTVNVTDTIDKGKGVKKLSFEQDELAKGNCTFDSKIRKGAKNPTVRYYWPNIDTFSNADDVKGLASSVERIIREVKGKKGVDFQSVRASGQLKKFIASVTHNSLLRLINQSLILAHIKKCITLSPSIILNSVESCILNNGVLDGKSVQDSEYKKLLNAIKKASEEKGGEVVEDKKDEPVVEEVNNNNNVIEIKQ